MQLFLFCLALILFLEPSTIYLVITNFIVFQCKKKLFKLFESHFKMSRMQAEWGGSVLQTAGAVMTPFSYLQWVIVIVLTALVFDPHRPWVFVGIHLTALKDTFFF